MTARTETAVAPFRPEAGPWRQAFVLTSAGVVIAAFSTAMFLVGAATLFRRKRFCREVLGKWLGRTLLFLAGWDLDVHGHIPEPNRQVVYVFNHTSTLDAVILLAMRLPRTRFFLYGTYRRYLPVRMIGWAIGIFFTCPQSDRAGRVRVFQGAGSVLRATGDSVALSPEGARITNGEIGPFNKGAFHLATSLGAPLVPIYFAIPRSANPGKGLFSRPARVQVHVGEAISTADWALEDLDANRARVRDHFLALNRRLARA